MELAGYLGRSEEADDIEVFHGLSPSVGDQLKQVDLLLEDL